MRDEYEIVVVGGGIVGLATALGLLAAKPSLNIAVLEKEAAVGTHQTGHNSGVVHSGVYYKPGSLKAELCVRGVDLLRRFCETEGIDYEPFGKVLVAVDPSEVPALEELHRRATANGVPNLRRLNGDELREIEPHAAGVAGVHVPGTASVDFTEVARAMARRVEQQGGTIFTNCAVSSIDAASAHVRLGTPIGELAGGHLVNCAGLYSDRVARLAGADIQTQIIPFRGEYYQLRPERADLVKGMIYPVPDPRFPFLGVHFTRTVHSHVEAGPNAVLALAREGYRWGTIRPRELWETLRYPGMWSLAKRYWRTALGEMTRSISKRAFVAGLRRLVPSIEMEDVVRAGAGVRAQAVDRRGNLLDDFAIEESPRAIHVLNAPSPGATAALAIGRHLATVIRERFDLD